jgi:hypothetical protein
MFFRKYHKRDPHVLAEYPLRQYRIKKWYGYVYTPFYDTLDGEWFVHTEFVELYYNREYKQVYVRLLRPSDWLGDKEVAGKLPENDYLFLTSKDIHRFGSEYEHKLRGRKITIEVEAGIITITLSHKEQARRVIFRASDSPYALWLREWE